MYTGQGNREPEISAIEHDVLSQAKRSLILGLNDAGNAFIGPTVFDYVSSNPLAVVLVDTNGDPYVASGGGGGPAANVSAYISGTISLPVYVFTSTTLNSVVGGTVTASIALGTVTASIALGTVTANIGLGTVTANIGLGTVTANIGLGTVTANVAGNVTGFIHSGTLTANIGLGTVTANIGLGTVTVHMGSGTATVFSAAHNVTAFVAASVTLRALIDTPITAELRCNVILGTVTANVIGNVTCFHPAYQHLTYTVTNFLVTLKTSGPVLVCPTNLTRSSVEICNRTVNSVLCFVGGISNASGDGYFTIMAQTPYRSGGPEVHTGAIHGTTTLDNTIVHVFERMWST